MKTIQAGELNRRVQIIEKTFVANAAGYGTEQESVVHCCWAKVSKTSGTELVKANADFGQEKVRFLIRWTSRAIDRKMFVRYAGRDYEIEYINDYAGRQYLEIWGVWQSREGS